MATNLPASTRQSMEGFRDRLLNVMDRWWPWRHADPRDTRLDMPLDLSSVFTGAGPAVDVCEDANHVRVTAELPGLDRDDFDIEVYKDRVVLRGEKKHSREQRDRNYYYSECSYGSFARSIPLPCEIDPDKSNATYTRGVLNLELPKTEAAKARRITVKVN